MHHSPSGIPPNPHSAVPGELCCVQHGALDYHCLEATSRCRRHPIGPQVFDGEILI